MKMSWELSWVFSAIWFLVTEHILKPCTKGLVIVNYNYIYLNR